MTMPTVAPAPVAPVAPAAPRLPVYQSGVDDIRSGCYTGMTTLSSSHIQANGVKLLWKCMLGGDYRGSEHQPLVIPDVVQQDGTTCDVMLLSSMSDDIYCWDFSNPDPSAPSLGRLIWKQRIGVPVNIAQYDSKGSWNNPYDMYPINRPFWGGLSCPYVDLATATMYVCIASTVDGTMPNVRYYLHALNLQDGSAKCPPLDISTAVYQSLGGPIAHDAMPRKQRAGLAFHSYQTAAGPHDVIFICDSTFAMMNDAAHGFLVACDVTGLRTGTPMAISCCWTASAPPYAGSGIWMAGGAPVIDEQGCILIVTANGAFDPPKGCYGNSAVKLQYNPPTASAAASLEVLTWGCFYTDAGRTGYDPTIPWIGLCENVSTQMDGQSMTAPDDQDLGCGQGTYIPKSISGFTDNLFIPCGKDGVSIGLTADAMPNTLVGDFAPALIQTNWAKALWVTGATYYPGTFDITPTDLATDYTTVDGYTHHQHSDPPWYVSNDHGLLVYYGGENGPVRVFQVTQDKGTSKYACTFLAAGSETASAGVPSPGGMPGTFMSISTCGSTPNTGVLWCLMPLDGDANKAIVQGRLVIKGANWVDETTKTLMTIWDSANYAELKWSHCKFAKGTPALDKFALPTYDSQVWVFG